MSMKLSPESHFRAFVLLLTVLLTASPAYADKDSKDESKPTVILFSIDFCPSCLATRKHLEDEGIPFQEFNIQENERAREAFDRLGGRGIPFIFIDGKTMTGFDPDHFDKLWAEVTGEG